MHRTLPSPSGPYRVVFTPQAWREIGLMPTVLFDAFQRAVDDLAAKCARLNVSASELPSSSRFTVEALVVAYERDDAGRTLTLVEISRLPAISP